ncbi:MAG TPA: DUF5752 family protein [Candidatus Nanoarchaeia archaeon]|nr:DUF5752 family protein [Candidatus Nanoarchaeia archaeon]
MNLQNAQENQVFLLKGGRKIRNLHELVRELHRADEETFRYHVNEQKNDFANWIKDVLKDNVLATRVRNVKDKAAMERFVGTRIHELRTAEQPVQQNRIVKPVVKAKPALKQVVAPVEKPKIVMAGPTTKMKIVPHRIIVKTGPTTKLNVHPQRTVVNAGKTTPLHIAAKEQIEKTRTIIKTVVSKSRDYASTITGYVLLGIVMGVAIMIASLVLL